MTFKEFAAKYCPDIVSECYDGGCAGCPHGLSKTLRIIELWDRKYNYQPCEERPESGDAPCRECWEQEINPDLFARFDFEEFSDSTVDFESLIIG